METSACALESPARNWQHTSAHCAGVTKMLLRYSAGFELSRSDLIVVAVGVVLAALAALAL